MHKPQIRWGILGAANIARKNWQAIRHSGNGVITAVASRELERSRRFIAECQAHTPFPAPPRALGSYEPLIAADDVDAVYIPLPTGLRKEWVLRAAQAGKHVLCEKPCAASVADLKEMIDVCERHHVQFMDGVMFMHSQRLPSIRAVLNDQNTIGQIRRITSAFDFNAPAEFFRSNIRVDTGLEPFGSLGDLGWYCIRFILWALDWQLPRQTSGRILSDLKRRGDSHSAITEFSAELLFAGGISAQFYCSFITDLEQWVYVSGTRGFLHVRDFVLPFYGSQASFETGTTIHNVQGCDFNIEPNLHSWAVNEYSNSHPTAQEANMFRNFADLVLAGKLDPFWPDIALKTQQVLEACYQSALAQSKVVELGSAA